MDVLSERENEIALQLTLGLSQKEIADKLFVSPHTVRNHLVNIQKKTDSRGAVDIVRKYILALDEPKRFFKAMGFLAIQLFIIFSLQDMDLRKGRRGRRGREYYSNELILEYESD